MLSIKQFQKDVIESYSKGSDVFCISGTGSGKSLTYILCPFVQDYILQKQSMTKDSLDTIALIIQPLKSLMKDQCRKLKSLGLKATYVGDEHDFSGMTSNKFNYIIASPETAISQAFLDTIESLKKNIACIFVDESHCIQTL